MKIIYLNPNLTYFIAPKTFTIISKEIASIDTTLGNRLHLQRNPLSMKNWYWLVFLFIMKYHIHPYWISMAATFYYRKSTS